MSSTSRSNPAGVDVGVGISERFRAAVSEVALDAADLLPTRLAEVTCAVVGCEGAGLSVMSQQFRVPLGASSPEAAAIERLQFTTEQGPCWDAIRTDLPLVVGHDDITRRWPQFAAELRRVTRFASIASVPLRLGRGVGGALDMYFVDPVAADRFDLDDATVVAAHIVDQLNRAGHSGRSPDLHGVSGPVWARGGAARGRLAVWIAVGMVMDRAAHLPADGLARLRAAAYSAGRSLDEIAADVLAGRVDPAQLPRP